VREEEFSFPEFTVNGLIRKDISVAFTARGLIG
jgi:hypothetical protein